MLGGEPKTVPDLNPDRDILIGWSDNSADLFIQIGINGRIERVDVPTGQRTLLRTVGPPDRAGFQEAYVNSIRQDGKYYAYWYWKQLTTLFLVDGLR